MKRTAIERSCLRLLPFAVGLALGCASTHALAAPLGRHAAADRQFEPTMRALADARQRHLAATKNALAPGVSTRVVTNCNDAGAGSLRDAAAAAASGDTIDLGQLHCSSISLTSGAITATVDDLRIRGPKHGSIVLDGNGVDRVLTHTGAGTLVLSGLSLRHGQHVATTSPYAGGCLYTFGTLDLDDVRISECSASAEGEMGVAGGGAFAGNGATIRNSVISSSSAQSNSVAIGGGLFVYGNALIARSTISGNSTSTTSAGANIDASGGGVFVYGSLGLSRCEISGNSVHAESAYGYTFAVANEAGIMAFGHLQVDDSTISANSAVAINTSVGYTGYAVSVGGGARAGSMSVNDSTISGNTTLATANNPAGYGNEYSSGGGLRTFNGGTMELANSTISGNRSQRSMSSLYSYGYATGGGIMATRAELTLQNSTIAFNVAEDGAGVDLYQPTSTSLDSTIIAANDSTAGGTDFASFDAIAVVGANNLVGSAGANLTLPAGTLAGDPQLAPLADNGGPTWTHVLLAGSPAIDAGSNIAGLRFDQRGPGFPRRIGVRSDIGAVEARCGD